ncbi:hypothetical protein Tco_0458490 [Tanacetum coccineum]
MLPWFLRYSKKSIQPEATSYDSDYIRKLVADSVTSALEAQAATMASASNPDRNTGPTGTPVVKTGNYKEFISCQPFYFNGTEGAVGLIRWFERTESVFSRRTSTTAPRSQTTTTANTKQSLNYTVRHVAGRAYAVTPSENGRYAGDLPLCNREAIFHRNGLVLANLYVMPVEKKGIIQISAQAQTSMPKKSRHAESRNCQQEHETSLVMEKKSDEKKLEDIPVVKEFRDVFPEDSTWSPFPFAK